MGTATALESYSTRSLEALLPALLRRVETRPQFANEPLCTRYRCRYMDLFVWSDGTEFVGLELDYAIRPAEELSIRWSTPEGLIFSDVQPADEDYKQVLVPVASEEPPLAFITTVFAAVSHNMDHAARRYVIGTLVAALQQQKTPYAERRC